MAVTNYSKLLKGYGRKKNKIQNIFFSLLRFLLFDSVTEAFSVLQMADEETEDKGFKKLCEVRITFHLTAEMERVSKGEKRSTFCKNERKRR